MPTVEVLVLGPLAVRVDGREADLTGAMPRRLLALLAARSGTDVTADALVEDLWQGAPPAGATATLQSHVARLRRVVGPDAIRTRPSGYRLEAYVDATAFEAAVRAARAGHDGVDVLRSALQPWRGPAYDGLREAAPLAIEGQRLDELRLAATLECVAAEQRLGRTVGHVDELEDLVRRHPMSEPLWGLLIRALAAEGRQADALAAYQRARVALRDELGVEPSAALRELEHQVLTQDPRLLALGTTPAAAPPEQRRVVTVLALEVADSDPDAPDPEVAAVTARRLTLKTILEDHGGTLLPSPGLTAFAVVGAPVAHDDDAARAVGAAQALLADGIAVRAGLATGVVVADDSGQPRPGPVTQRAERLARQARQGELRIDQATRAAALAVGAPGVTGPFTGRDDDLWTLRQAAARVRDRGSAQLVTVVAEAGIGKTRLCQEFVAELDEATMLVRRAVCPAYGEAAGLRVVGALLGRDPGRAEDIGSRDDAFERWGSELRTEAGERPLVLVVDDVHWADELVTGFLHHLVTDDRPILVVVAARPELHRRHPTWGHGAPAATTLHLSPLSDEAVAALVGAVASADDETRRRIVEQAGGVPLHAVELTRLAGTDARTDPGSTLAGVLSARLDTLTSPARDAVVDASVIGKTFPVSALVAVSGRPLAEVQEELRELVEREFVRRIAGEPGRPAMDREYVFTHDLVRAAAYDRLLRRDAARRHVATVTWAESNRRGDVAFLAHHARRAHELAEAVGDDELAATTREPAFRFSYEAGEAVLGLETAAAIGLFTRAVALAEPGTHDHARAQCRIGQALFDAGHFAEAAPYLRSGLEGLEDVPDPLRIQASMWEMWNNFALGHDLDGPAREVARLVEELPRSVDTATGLGALAALSMIQQTQESQRRAIDQAEAAMRVAEEVGHPERSGLPRAVRGRARLGLGDPGGLEEMDGALADLSRWEMGSYQVAFYIWQAGALHHWRGPAEELAARRELESVAVRRGLGYMTSFSVAEEVRCLAELGRLREAITLAETVNVEDDAQPRWAVVARALALADLGELDARTITEVEATPPASEDDLRHVLGKMLVAGTWRPAEVPGLLAGLGDLAPYCVRDGAFEMLSRLVRMAQDAGCADAVAGFPDLSGLTPLSQAIGPHVTGLVTRDPDLLLVAVERWRALGHATEHALALLDLAEATPVGDLRTARAAEACDALTALGMAPWAERAGRA